jgi:hypothetical protein
MDQYTELSNQDAVGTRKDVKDCLAGLGYATSGEVGVLGTAAALTELIRVRAKRIILERNIT